MDGGVEGSQEALGSKDRPRRAQRGSAGRKVEKVEKVENDFLLPLAPPLRESAAAAPARLIDRSSRAFYLLALPLLLLLLSSPSATCAFHIFHHRLSGIACDSCIFTTRCSR